MFKNKLKKIIGNDENQGNNKRKIEVLKCFLRTNLGQIIRLLT